MVRPDYVFRVFLYVSVSARIRFFSDAFLPVRLSQGRFDPVLPVVSRLEPLIYQG